MHPDPQFWAGKQVGISGGSGFLGWHLVNELRTHGALVRVLGLAPPSGHPLWHRSDVAWTEGDVLDAACVRDLTRGCDVLFHLAGPVAIFGPALKSMREIHLEGTRNVLAAAPGRCRVVHTSSVMAVGARQDGKPLTEESPFDLSMLKMDYVHAKRRAEQTALDAARRGQWVAVVNPAYLVGPADHQPSVMGRFCLRYWKGRVPLAPPGGLNLADVRDVARGHLLAAEHGQPGRRYILGGENHALAEFMSMLGRTVGKDRHHLAVPWWLLAVAASFAEFRARLCRREPYPGLQHVRLNRYFWFYSSQRAQRELGYECRPLRQTLADTIAWFREQGKAPTAGTSGSRVHLSKVLAGRFALSFRSTKLKTSSSSPSLEPACRGQS